MMFGHGHGHHHNPGDLFESEESLDMDTESDTESDPEASGETTSV